MFDTHTPKTYISLEPHGKIIKFEADGYADAMQKWYRLGCTGLLCLALPWQRQPSGYTNLKVIDGQHEVVHDVKL